jgi:hypothetical protein
VYKVWSDENESVVATTNGNFVYVDGNGNSMRAVATPIDGPNRHFIVEEDYGEARTGVRFLLSSIGQKLDLDVFELKENFDTGSIRMTTSKDLGMPYLSTIFNSPLTGLEHLRMSEAGTAGIALGDSSHISVFVPKFTINSLSGKLQKNDLTKRVSDEIAGKRVTCYDPDGSYFADGIVYGENDGDTNYVSP